MRTGPISCRRCSACCPPAPTSITLRELHLRISLLSHDKVEARGWPGEEGVTRVSVAQSLGLTSKRANRALAAFAAKHRIRETFAQQGKAQIKVSAPRAFTTGLDFPAFPW